MVWLQLVLEVARVSQGFMKGYRAFIPTRWSSQMTHLFVRLATIAMIALPVSQLIGQDCTHLEGQWQNELGSVLVIDQVLDNGSIAGEYRSSTGVDGKTFPLQGWVNNYQSEIAAPVSIAFSVRWSGYSSITSWSGTCDNNEDGPFIKTLWHLVRPDQEFEWERIIANSSTFTPLNK